MTRSRPGDERAGYADPRSVRAEGSIGQAVGRSVTRSARIVADHRRELEPVARAGRREGDARGRRMTIDDERLVGGVRVEADLGMDAGGRPRPASRRRMNSRTRSTSAFGCTERSTVSGSTNVPPVMDRDLEPELGVVRDAVVHRVGLAQHPDRQPDRRRPSTGRSWREPTSALRVRPRAGGGGRARTRRSTGRPRGRDGRRRRRRRRPFRPRSRRPPPVASRDARRRSASSAPPRSATARWAAFARRPGAAPAPGRGPPTTSSAGCEDRPARVDLAGVEDLVGEPVRRARRRRAPDEALVAGPRRARPSASGWRCRSRPRAPPPIPRRRGQRHVAGCSK